MLLFVEVDVEVVFYVVGVCVLYVVYVCLLDVIELV